MNLLRLIVREFVGLFVDDEKLALSILAVVGACGLLARYQQGTSITVGLLLLFGCIGVLVVSVLQGARR
ncbi:hypothetical protein [Bosea sp. BIWAKO-01]|uniref:hypothetical protein n=1 Tax=Bosea sp. BIWAKO-01 TaxID=506668 RepID=UPI0008534CDA|nr:hypothetical protein [Bosea sp. BIWAKO-01]GAU85884.1 hypothetical protein BIWAKO_05832 [Bosea sp. BIWAKO-01]